MTNKLGIDRNNTSSFKDLCKSFAQTKIHLSFTVPFQFKINKIADHMLKWLLSTENSHAFSVVGVMSSIESASVIQDHLGSQVAAHFKAVIYGASSLRHLSFLEETGYLSQLLRVVDSSGFHLLKQLEQLVSPQGCRRLTIEARLALLLLLIGTIISVKYYEKFIEVCYPLAKGTLDFDEY
jgi:hypothetical protein